MVGKFPVEGAIRFFDWQNLPEGWQFSRLDNHCRVRRGSSPRPAGDPRYFGEGNIPWFKIGDATKTGSRFLERTEEFVNEEGAKKSVKIAPGTLIVANSGVSLGFAVITKVEGCVHDGWLILDDFNGIDRNYLYYFINLLTQRIRQMADGTTQPNLNTGIASRLLLALPPLQDQKAIASILGSLDDKIELNRRMNATLEAMVSASFNASFAESEEAKDWETGKLSEIASINREAINPIDYPEEMFNHYSIPAFDDGGFPKQEKGEEIKSNKFVVQSNCVMLSKLNPRIKRIWLPFSLEGRSICSTEFLVTEPSAQISQAYLFGLVGSQLFQGRFASMVTGTSGSHQRVKAEYVLDIEIAIPSKDAITAFTNVAKPLLEKYQHNILESRALAILRDTLLPKLMRGEVRVTRP